MIVLAGRAGAQIINLLSSMHMGSFIPRIKVYAYANKHAPERKVILSPYFKMLQTVVV